MKIHHLRNATFVIEAGNNVVLIDPMLGEKGSILPFAILRFRARKNPTVDLPTNAENILKKVTHCLITHKHPDHIDLEGIKFLKQKSTPVTCSHKDIIHFKKKGLNEVQPLEYWKKEPFLGGSITGIPAKHGYGFIAKPMGNVMGFHIELPNTSSIYISADTIYTNDVDKVLKDLKPRLSIVACGTAQLDIGKPLLMHLDDIITFVRNSPGIVYANHMEALNHCPTTRQILLKRLLNEGLVDKVLIPNDGDTIDWN